MHHSSLMLPNPIFSFSIELRNEHFCLGCRKKEVPLNVFLLPRQKNLVSVGQAKPAHAVGSILKEIVADEARISVDNCKTSTVMQKGVFLAKLTKLKIKK